MRVHAEETPPYIPKDTDNLILLKTSILKASYTVEAEQLSTVECVPFARLKLWQIQKLIPIPFH